MKIRIRDINPEGTELAEEISADTLVDVDERLARFTVPLMVKAKFEKINKTVIVHTKIQTKYSALCARCLEPVERNWDRNVLFDFQVKNETDYIELDDEVRQEVILNLPTRTLCQENCKGLCVGCGANLNVEECRCK